jgi:hypothetical protein
LIIALPHYHDDDQKKEKYRAIINCHSVKNDAFVPRERPDDSTIPATITKIMSETFIDMITFVVNFAQEQNEGAE